MYSLIFAIVIGYVVPLYQSWLRIFRVVWRLLCYEIMYFTCIHFDVKWFLLLAKALSKTSLFSA